MKLPAFWRHMGRYMKKKNESSRYASVVFVTGVITAIGVIFLILLGAAAYFTAWQPMLIAGMLAAIYVLVCVTIALIMRRIREKASGDYVIKSVLGSVLRDAVQWMELPVVICDETDAKIVWNNRAASALLGEEKPLFGMRFDKFSGIATGEVLYDEDESGVESVVGGHRVMLRGTRIRVSDKAFNIFTLEDISELYSLTETAKSNESVVCQIVVDNLSDVGAYDQDRFRDCSSRVAAVISQWAKDCEGILREYERDKYLLIMSAGHLAQSVERRFDVLDRIRDIRVGAIPVTVSVGICCAGNTLAEREKGAASALEYAIQRGGDQIVVKGESSTEFYGGRTKTVQKRTKVRSRVIAGQLTQYMEKASNVLVMGHKFADFDAFGACVGVARLARLVGAKVNIVSDLSDPGLDECRRTFASDSAYSGVFVDSADALDLVTSKTLLIVVDVNNTAFMEAPELLSACGDYVVIDHHRKISEFEREPLVSYIEPSASATCELVAEMLEQMLSSDDRITLEAQMMMAGIILDTKQFSANTTARTFSAALYLRSQGANPTEAMRYFRTPLEDYVREAKFRTNVVIYRSVIAIALGDGEGESADRVAAAKSADKLLAVEGVRASFALIRIDGVVHISARSSGDINVQLILEQLKGGGHYDAAGAQVEAKSVSDALSMLKKAIDTYLDENK